jgi:hypothetical protein
VEVWKCGKISLILFCTKREQADKKKDQAIYEFLGKRSRLNVNLGKKDQAEGESEEKRIRLCIMFYPEKS